MLTLFNGQIIEICFITYIFALIEFVIEVLLFKNNSNTQTIYTMNQKIVKIFGKKAVIVKSDRKAYFVKVPIYDKSNLTQSGTYSIIGSRKIFVPAPSFVFEGYALQGFLKSKSETIAQFNQRHEKQNV